MSAPDFVNRRDELARLADWWRQGMRPALVWGRRWVGKTALLQKMISSLDAAAIFHAGAGRSTDGELTQLARQVAS